jgi:hypothetical protein
LFPLTCPTQTRAPGAGGDNRTDRGKIMGLRLHGYILSNHVMIVDETEVHLDFGKYSMCTDKLVAFGSDDQ